jgi:hypothetical protein
MVNRQSIGLVMVDILDKLSFLDLKLSKYLLAHKPPHIIHIMVHNIVQEVNNILPIIGKLVHIFLLF